MTGDLWCPDCRVERERGLTGIDEDGNPTCPDCGSRLDRRRGASP